MASSAGAAASPPSAAGAPAAAASSLGASLGAGGGVGSFGGGGGVFGFGRRSVQIGSTPGMRSTKAKSRSSPISAKRIFSMISSSVFGSRRASQVLPVMLFGAHFGGLGLGLGFQRKLRKLREEKSTTEAINIRDRNHRIEHIVGKPSGNAYTANKTQANSALNKIIYYYKHSNMISFYSCCCFVVVGFCWFIGKTLK